MEKNKKTFFLSDFLQIITLEYHCVVSNAKSFATAILFFFFLLVLLPYAVFGRTDKSFCCCFITRYPASVWSYSLDTLANLFISVPFIVKRRVCDPNMPCALEINSNGGFKQEHVGACSSIAKNIKSPLSQCLAPPNLAGWWLRCRRLPTIKLCDPSITLSSDITW